MQTFEVKTEDGISLHVQKWNDIEKGEKTLLIIHGLGEHQGRYEHVAEHFAKDGFETYTYDQRGHGKSDGQRGHSPGIAASLDDLERVIESIPHENLYLYGHSFGGNVTANFVLRKDCSTLRAVVLSSAWLRLHEEPSKTDIILASIMSVIYPKFTQNNQLDPDDLSYIKQVGEDYENDPLTHNQISAGLFKSFHATGIWAIENASQLSTPTFVLHGADDSIIGVRGSKEFAKNAGELASLHIYEKTKHEPHNDNKAGEILDNISVWFKQINDG
ncbi:MAG TPA: alpha/beta hydrolase [Flavobacteriales bacterium]|jgi:alpha-beta hydrolase superfamily lysophospholipase|nr:alpha/beta hydrolase [Flavobacteriales bacterium]HIN41741.1 alpha/beta hydrolase [Flavobacteriales bacterium]